MLSVKKQTELRETLPYGVYIGSDGRETLFNRSYQPMFTRATVNEAPQPCKPHTWIKFKDQAFFFNDGNSPFYDDNKKNKDSRKRCESVLIAFHHGESIERFFESMQENVGEE
jgi:hypothetical protein